MSEWLALALAMAGACLVVVAVVLVRHRKADEDEDTSETPDVIEYITMMIGVVYAIVLGLAIAGVWESRSAAQDDVQTEAQSLHEVSARAEVFPADYRAVVQKDVDTYVSFVVDTEWHYMRTHGEIGEISPRAPSCWASCAPTSPSGSRRTTSRRRRTRR